MLNIRPIHKKSNPKAKPLPKQILKPKEPDLIFEDQRLLNSSEGFEFPVVLSAKPQPTEMIQNYKPRILKNRVNSASTFQLENQNKIKNLQVISSAKLQLDYSGLSSNRPQSEQPNYDLNKPQQQIQIEINEDIQTRNQPKNGSLETELYTFDNQYNKRLETLESEVNEGQVGLIDGQQFIEDISPGTEHKSTQQTPTPFYFKPQQEYHAELIPTILLRDSCQETEIILELNNNSLRGQRSSSEELKSTLKRKVSCEDLVIQGRSSSLSPKKIKESNIGAWRKFAARKDTIIPFSHKSKRSIAIEHTGEVVTYANNNVRPSLKVPLMKDYQGIENSSELLDYTPKNQDNSQFVDHQLTKVNFGVQTINASFDKNAKLQAQENSFGDALKSINDQNVNYDQLKQKLANDMKNSKDENTKKYQNLSQSITHKPSLKARAELDQQKHIQTLLSKIGKQAIQEFPQRTQFNQKDKQGQNHLELGPTGQNDHESLIKISNIDNIQIREMFNQERYVKIQERYFNQIYKQIQQFDFAKYQMPAEVPAFGKGQTNRARRLASQQKNQFKINQSIWDHMIIGFDEREDLEQNMEEVFLRGNKKMLQIRERDIEMKKIEQKCIQTQTSSSDSGLASGLVLPSHLQVSSSNIPQVPQIKMDQNQFINAAKSYKQIDQDDYVAGTRITTERMSLQSSRSDSTFSELSDMNNDLNPIATILQPTNIGISTRKLHGINPRQNTLNVKISKKKKQAKDQIQQFSILQLRKSLIKKGQYFKGAKKFKNLKIDDADLNEMELISEFGNLAHPQKTKNLRVNLAKMYKMDQKLSKKLSQDEIQDNDETFNLVNEQVVDFTRLNQANGTQQKQKVESNEDIGLLDMAIKDVSFDGESDELNIGNYPKVSVLRTQIHDQDKQNSRAAEISLSRDGSGQIGSGIVSSAEAQDKNKSKNSPGSPFKPHEKKDSSQNKMPSQDEIKFSSSNNDETINNIRLNVPTKKKQHVIKDQNQPNSQKGKERVSNVSYVGGDIKQMDIYTIKEDLLAPKHKTLNPKNLGKDPFGLNKDNEDIKTNLVTQKEQSPETSTKFKPKYNITRNDEKLSVGQTNSINYLKPVKLNEFGVLKMANSKERSKESSQDDTPMGQMMINEKSEFFIQQKPIKSQDLVLNQYQKLTGKIEQPLSIQSENTGSFMMQLKNEQSQRIIEIFHPNKKEEDVPSMSKLLFDRLEPQIIPLKSVKEENQQENLMDFENTFLDLTRIQAIFLSLFKIQESIQTDEIFTQKILKEFIDQNSFLDFKKFQDKKDAMSALKSFFDIKVPHDIHQVFSPQWLILMIITSLDLLEVKNANLQSFLDSKIINDKNKSIKNKISLLRGLLNYSKNQVMSTAETVGLQEMNNKILRAISEHQHQQRPFYQREMNNIQKQIG